MSSKFKLWSGRIKQDKTAHPKDIILPNVTKHNNVEPAWAKGLKSGGKTMDNGQWTMDNVIWMRWIGRGV